MPFFQQMIKHTVIFIHHMRNTHKPRMKSQGRGLKQTNQSCRSVYTDQTEYRDTCITTLTSINTDKTLYKVLINFRCELRNHNIDNNKPPKLGNMASQCVCTRITHDYSNILDSINLLLHTENTHCYLFLITYN